jgi:hypothetical protein
MKTIVEVGAYRGAETFSFFEEPMEHLDCDVIVYAFEPTTSDFRELFIRSRFYPRLNVLPFAIDIGDNQEPLFQYPDGQSTLQPDFFTSKKITFNMTWTIRLDTFMHLYSIDDIDYLRIDVPFRGEMCLESLAERILDVRAGRIKLYGNDDAAVMNILTQAGFTLGPATHDLPFWR